MTITAAADTSAASASKSLTSGKSLAKNFDTFLTMLTVQLKHQDPLSPMDSTQFTNQLVQFAGVEQQINANSNLEKLITATSLNTKSQALGYIGHYVEADSNMVPLQGGADKITDKVELIGGKSTFNYTLDGTAATTQLKITNANGVVVRTIAGEIGKGRHEYTWDGTDSSGQKVADGTYTVTATSTATSGSTVGTTISTATRTGNASFSYTLASEAQSCSVVIKDAAGTIVRNLTGIGTAGRHEMTWDGKDKNGKDLPDGAYTVSVAALDGEGKTVESATTVYGKVTDISSDSEGTLLAMGKVVTTIEKVLTVRDAASVSN
jgi:flagellar basal-body rod modification protein FlgD